MLVYPRWILKLCFHARIMRTHILELGSACDVAAPDADNIWRVAIFFFLAGQTMAMQYGGDELRHVPLRELLLHHCVPLLPVYVASPRAPLQE